jgi:hypothetical protein
MHVIIIHANDPFEFSRIRKLRQKSQGASGKTVGLKALTTLERQEFLDKRLLS